MLPLAGLAVAVTRPAHQADALIARLSDVGATAYKLPLLALRPLSDAESVAAIDRQLAVLNQFDFAIFISRNAVDFTLQALAERGLHWPAQLPAYTVGTATARYAEQQGIPCTTPTDRLDSEGLLALPPMQQVAGLRGIIFRADTGRELLADTLSARGAQISRCMLYQRHLPTSAAADWRQFLRLPAQQRAVCINSSETLDHWLSLATLAEAQATVTVVPAQRLQQQALARGLTQVLLAVDATDDTILKTLLHWYAP